MPLSHYAGEILRRAGRFVPPQAVLGLARPAAVFFHGVETAIEDPVVQNNHHTKDRFRQIAETLKTHFDVLPLAALDDVLARPGKHPRALFLMADDGYGNMLATADLLEEMQLPWTLFVSTHHIDTGERNPLFLARLFFRYARAGRYGLPHIDGIVDLVAGERTVEAQRVLARLKTMDEAHARQTLSAMQTALAQMGLERLTDLFPSDSFLSWADVAALSRRGVEIGAHAHWHWPMNAHQSHEDLRRQAALPRERIMAVAGACRAFAYPFGNRGGICKAAWQAVRDAGYTHAFTALSGTLDSGGNNFLLPRYGLAREVSDQAAVIALLRAANPRLRRIQHLLA
ncbi:MAG: polysaccharide deacetylase family protein [Alphaproteobacteria bacterium]|nr:polysaccharide deacetylase family protein [Alphaproteobacteria bacterium]MBN9578530.1 polysaccharide deacetylase family protein [Alphaproteobacteria bacterium]